MTTAVEESPPAPHPTVMHDRVESAALPGEVSSTQRQPILTRPLVLLGLITLLGAGLRFVSLDQPALWGDEAFTYSRICGSFRQLLDVLQFDGFMPLHYIVYWWIGQHVELSPTMMRVPVALAGAFMPPAMYFLARQLGISTRTALVTALFTACSAYMLAYSRDAKMYMPFWLFCATHVACLLWWMNGRGAGRPSEDRALKVVDGGQPAGRVRRVLRVLRRLLSAVLHSLFSIATSPLTFRWLCWIAAGLAMIGYHALGLMVAAVEVVIFLSHRNLHWKRLLPFVVGLAMVAGLWWGHFGYFTDWDNRVSESWNSSGVQWVNLYNAERTGGDLATFASTAFLMSWEWPVNSWRPNIDPRVLKTLMTVSVGIGLLAAAGLLCSLCRYAGGGRAKSEVVQHRAGWRTALWLAAWLLLPAYAIYCKSIPLGKIPFVAKSGPVFEAPWAIARDWLGIVGYRWPIAVAAMLVCIVCFWRSDSTLRRRLLRLIGIVVVSAIIFGLLSAEFGVLRWMAVKAAAKDDRWHSFWMPRYLGALWPAFAIILCSLLMSLPTRALRFGAIGLLLAANLVQFSVRVWGGSEPPTGMMARDIVAAQPLWVRQSQVALDLTRATFNLGTGLAPPRFDLAVRQNEKLPVVAPSTRTYMQTGIWSPEPGGGVLGSFAMRFYLCYYVGVDADPPSFRRRSALVDRQWTVVSGTSPRLIAADVEKMPAINHIIAWDRYDRGRRDTAAVDPISKALGRSWKKVDDRMFSARDHWTWMDKYQLRRREYVRVAPPAPVPAAPPATAPSTKSVSTAPGGPNLLPDKPATTTQASTKPATQK